MKLKRDETKTVRDTTPTTELATTTNNNNNNNNTAQEVHQDQRQLSTRTGASLAEGGSIVGRLLATAVFVSVPAAPQTKKGRIALRTSPFKR